MTSPSWTKTSSHFRYNFLTENFVDRFTPTNYYPMIFTAIACEFSNRRIKGIKIKRKHTSWQAHLAQLEEWKFPRMLQKFCYPKEDAMSVWPSLRKKCPNTEFFWSVFSRIRTLFKQWMWRYLNQPTICSFLLHVFQGHGQYLAILWGHFSNQNFLAN